MYGLVASGALKLRASRDVDEGVDNSVPLDDDDTDNEAGEEDEPK